MQDRGRDHRRPVASQRSWSLILLGLFIWNVAAACGQAGGGPENVVLVVNSRSWASQTIANHFVQLRHLSPNNVFYIDWTGDAESIDAETFRLKILGPLLLSVDRRGLADQIDYVVYSTDFPNEINVSGDLRGTTPVAQLSPTASITGATYLWQSVMTRNPHAVGLRNNEYMRAANGRFPTIATHGFRAFYGWGAQGDLLEAGGARYLLSTALAVTSGRGNSVSEAISYLRRSAQADGTHPKGTIYFMRNDDVRSATRAGGFTDAAQQLDALGVKAEVLEGVLPRHKQDVQGTMVGSDSFSWATSGSTILPGAICEHLTSFGGVLNETATQTPLTEFLRYGAAASSGTVVEPFAFQDKFPVPAIHVHYARGCSLAEAYYQSVFGPYQLLIVGDPLCRPWANIPTVKVDHFSTDKPLKGTVQLRPRGELPATGNSKPPRHISRFELYADGRRVDGAATGDPLRLDTTQLADGYHEVRVVAIESGPIESQGRLILPVTVDNQGHSITASAASNSVRWNESINLTAAAPGMDGIVFFHNARIVGKIDGEKGEASIEARQLGSGPVTLQAVAYLRSRVGEQVFSKPIRIAVKPAEALAALPAPVGSNLLRGLLLKPGAGKPVPIQETRDPNWLSAAGVKPHEAYRLEGYFQVPVDDLYQFQMRYTGELSLQVDQNELHASEDGNNEPVDLPVNLAAGLHHLRVSGRAGSSVQLRIRFGGQGTQSLSGTVFHHTDPEPR